MDTAIVLYPYIVVECLVLDREFSTSLQSIKSQFDLIVASSVCAFLPDYEGTLQLLKTLLKPNSLFIQWDWLKTEGDSDFGFTEEIIASAFLKADLEVLSITKAFSLESNEGEMQVLMGVAKKGAVT